MGEVYRGRQNAYGSVAGPVPVPDVIHVRSPENQRTSMITDAVSEESSAIVGIRANSDPAAFAVRLKIRLLTYIRCCGGADIGRFDDGCSPATPTARLSSQAASFVLAGI